ncbi:hypothetical protein [Lysobacter gummosus]
MKKGLAPTRPVSDESVCAGGFALQRPQSTGRQTSPPLRPGT